MYNTHKIKRENNIIKKIKISLKGMPILINSL